MIINLFIALLLLTAPSISLAAQNTNDFIPLVGIPFIQNGHVSTIGDYVNAFYYAAISVAAMLAVMKIIIAGVKYITTDIAPTKGQAKKDIRGAIIGLLIVVGAVLILRTINPNLTVVKLNAPNPSVGLQQGGPPPVLNKATQICNSSTGCDVVKCSLFENLIHWSCESWCNSQPNSVFIDKTNLTNVINTVSSQSISNILLGDSLTNECVIQKKSNNSLGGVLDLSTATASQIKDFKGSCTGTVATSTSTQNGHTIGICTINNGSTVNNQQIQQASFSTNYSATPTNLQKISSEIGKTITTKDIRGVYTIPLSKFPKTGDANTYSVTLSKQCTAAGGDSVAWTLSNATYSFWCVQAIPSSS